MLVVVVWYLHLVPVAVLDLKSISVLIFLGSNACQVLIYFFFKCADTWAGKEFGA